MTTTPTATDTTTHLPTPHRDALTRVVRAAPETIFGLITDPARLPSWNQAITEVVDAPATLAVGSVWRVRFRTFGHSWISRSEVTELDPADGRFGYRSHTDDGNPSYTDWRWHVRPDRLWTDRDHSVVTVHIGLQPLTFWRAHLMVHLRRPLLRRELHHSLAALGKAA